MRRSRPLSRARSNAGLRIVATLGPLALLMPTARAAAPLRSSERYIVMLDPTVRDPRAVAVDQTDGSGASVERVFGAVKGYTATFRPQDLAAVQKDPRTRLVAKDGIVRVVNAAPVGQTGAPYGVDRVDQPKLPVDGKFAATHDGEGVTAYIIDTGIRASHGEFGGRASIGADFVGDGRNGVDCDGHGTHVAGIIGGATYGVAKRVKLVAVRALDCDGSGTVSGVIAAVNWVAANHDANSVANMSLGGSPNSALDAAVAAAVAPATGTGVPFTIAAGNGNGFGGVNACTTSPARIGVAGAMTIGATDARDRRASFSNYGTCVDWFAPGVGITSAWLTSNTATRTLSGTSMAAPFTAGVAALYLDANRGKSPAAVEAALLKLSQESAVAQNSRTALEHSHIVYTGGTGSPPPPPPPPPNPTTTTTRPRFPLFPWSGR